MRITVGFLVIAFVSLLGNRSAAADEEGVPKECRAAAVKSFDKEVREVLKATEVVGKDADELWSTNPTFRKWTASPKTALTALEKRLRCYPDQELEAVRMLSAAIACLDLDAHLAYLRRLTQAPTSKANGWALYYGVFPGNQWSSKLAFNNEKESVKSTLQGVERAVNGTPGLQRVVLGILSGEQRREVESNPVKMLVTCPGKAVR